MVGSPLLLIREPEPKATTSKGIVDSGHFILATRETGYRSLASALAELVDNAIQAHARTVQVLVRQIVGGDGHSRSNREVEIAVLDDGEGMDPDAVWTALRFGGTERFDDRSGFGRFGMGLPNSSVSQSRRVELYSWPRPNEVFFNYLDVDEVADGLLQEVPAPVRRPLPQWAESHAAPTGTLVIWNRCDRLPFRKATTIAEKLRRPLGRIYRHVIWGGVQISINGELVSPVDPLFCHPTTGEGGAVPFGSPLTYEIAVPGSARTSMVRVRFTELPVAAWRDLNVEDKRARGIVGCAGVSFIRAGREIDYGWHLMGSKRKENYDDWWRCEVAFQPDLDEYFGVTHSKQGVAPTPELQAIVAPDIEAVAHTLNSRVRMAFETTRRRLASRAAQRATRQDALLPPLRARQCDRLRGRWGVTYNLEIRELSGREFFDVSVIDQSLTVTINMNHLFYDRLYAPAINRRDDRDRCILESILLAAARAEADARNAPERAWMRRYRAAWGDALAAFLEA